MNDPFLEQSIDPNFYIQIDDLKINRSFNKMRKLIDLVQDMR